MEEKIDKIAKGRLYGDEFYDSSQVIINSDGYPTPINKNSDEKWKKYLDKVVSKEVIRKVPFNFSKELYDNILKECSPTLRLFYTDEEGPTPHL